MADEIKEEEPEYATTFDEVLEKFNALITSGECDMLIRAAGGILAEHVRAETFDGRIKFAKTMHYESDVLRDDCLNLIQKLGKVKQRHLTLTICPRCYSNNCTGAVDISVIYNIMHKHKGNTQ